ncbi:hypothetical protein GQ53DRAFT_53643 [Thozetella sp. PMI_491]|nr:hypothetical protein GQ53DRAFT_53643 [Thozetella sp. PMI_491]
MPPISMRKLWGISFPGLRGAFSETDGGGHGGNGRAIFPAKRGGAALEQLLHLLWPIRRLDYGITARSLFWDGMEFLGDGSVPGFIGGSNRAPFSYFQDCPLWHRQCGLSSIRQITHLRSISIGTYISSASYGR